MVEEVEEEILIEEVEEEILIEDEEEVQEQLQVSVVKQTRCRHIMVSGKSKGSVCGSPAKENGLCAKHKSSTTATEPVKILVKEPVKAPVKEVAKAPVKEVAKVPVKAPVKEVVKQKTPPKIAEKIIEKVQSTPEEFIKFTNRGEEKKIEFRLMARDLLLDQKVYPPVPTTLYKSYVIVEKTRVVVNSEKTSIQGYLDDKDELVRRPTLATDKVVLDYGISFDTSHINDSDIDD